MPGMNERKRHMRGETKTARGDYGTKGYIGGGDIPRYKDGGKEVHTRRKNVGVNHGDFRNYSIRSEC